MKRFAFFAGVLLALLGVAAAALPWYIGVQAEQAMRAAPNRHPLLQSSPFEIKVADYRRGWFRSLAVHRVKLKAAPEMYFDVEHHIHHVPDSSGWVKVQSTPRFADETQRVADHFFGKQPALSAHSSYGFDGQVRTMFSSPAFKKALPDAEGANLVWGGASGTMVQDPDGHIRLRAEMPALDGRWPLGSAQLKGIRIEGDWTAGRAQTDWSGETKVALAEVNLHAPDSSAALKGLETSVVQRNNGNTVLLGYNLSVREGATSKQGGAPQGFSNAVLQVELDRLDKKALSKYMEGVSRADSARLTADAYNQQIVQLALGLMGDLLKGSPQVRVKQLGVQTAHGSISGKASISFNGKDLAPARSPFELLDRVTFSGSAQVSDKLLRVMLVDQARKQAVEAIARRGVARDEAQVALLSSTLVDQQLHALSQAGLLKVQGDNYVIQATFDQGRLTVNGLPGDDLLSGLFAPKEQPVDPDQET